MAENPEIMEFTIKLQDYLSNEMSEKGNEVSKALYGIRLFKEKNYFPLKTSDLYQVKDDKKGGDTGRMLRSAGFTNATVPHAKNPVVLTPFMQQSIEIQKKI